MQEFSWGWGHWSDWHQSYSYISLQGACSILGVERSDQAHRALGDCQAALAVLRALVARHGHIDLLICEASQEKLRYARRFLLTFP